MPATVEIAYYGGNATEPAGVPGEGGWKYNREDTISGSTPTSVPTSAGTNYSWIRNIALKVTTAFATTMSNRRIRLAALPATGLALHFKAAAYAQPATGSKPADTGTSDATPAGYTRLTAADQVYDAAGVSANATGRNGSMLQLVLGIADTYTEGANSARSLPNHILTYDEA